MKEQSEMSAFVWRAARVSVAAPLGAFVLFQCSIFAARMGAKWPISSSWLITIVSGVLVIAGFACGIVALCGIPRYGAPLLLWRGLLGVLAFAAVVVVSAIDILRVVNEVAR